MKKVFMIVAIAATTMSVNAQIRFGAQAGVNMASVKVEAYDEDTERVEELDSDSKIGFTLGVVADIPLTTSLSFMPELNFVQKGYKYEASFGSAKIESEATLNYIELPLNIVYRAPAGTGNVFFGAGPSIGFGISGKQKQTLSGLGGGFDGTTENDIKFDGDEKATDDDMHLKSLDFGANLLAGYEMSNGVFIKVGYTFGFSNISPEYPAPYDKNSWKNSGLSLKIGYMFGGGKTNGND